MEARWIGSLVIALMFLGAGKAWADEALARRSGCLECHSVDKKVIGPAFRDIAERYRDVAGARARLVEKVQQGGKGNWTDLTGGVPMPGHSPRLSDAETQLLVDWVMSF